MVLAKVLLEQRLNIKEQTVFAMQGETDCIQRVNKTKWELSSKNELVFRLFFLSTSFPPPKKKIKASDCDNSKKGSSSSSSSGSFISIISGQIIFSCLAPPKKHWAALQQTRASHHSVGDAAAAASANRGQFEAHQLWPRRDPIVHQPVVLWRVC